MIRPGFLSADERSELRALARDGSSEARAARRANAIVLLDSGWSCAEVAGALLIDDDTVRSWHGLYAEHGLTGLVVMGHQGSKSHLSREAEAALVAWVGSILPRNTRIIGAWIAKEHGVAYSHAGLIALLHRLKLVYRKPDLVSAKLDPARQEAFIADYERLLTGLGSDEAVVFADAVHPTHQARAVGCWAPAEEKIAIAPASGRDRLNIHGAVNLETGQTQMLEVASADARSTIQLLAAILSAYPSKRLIHVFLDNARYHHARQVAAMAGARRREDRAALRSRLQPAPQPDRTAVGRHAPQCHAQHLLRKLPQVQAQNHGLPDPRSSQKLARIPRLGHRQFPHHNTRRFSGCEVGGVY